MSGFRLATFWFIWFWDFFFLSFHNCVKWFNVVVLQRTSDQTLSGPQGLFGLFHVCSRQTEDGEKPGNLCDLFKTKSCRNLRLMRLLSCEQEMIESIREAVVYMAHTHDGARVAMHCLWHGTAKVRAHKNTPTNNHKSTVKVHCFIFGQKCCLISSFVPV